MCTGAEIAALAASAAGTYIQTEKADDAADRQQAILRAADEENQQINRAGEETIQKFATENFAPESRIENYEAGAAQREKSLAEALTSASTGGDAASGNVSSDYLSARADSMQSASAEAAKRAKLLARTGAGGMLGVRDAMMGGQMSSDLSGLGVKSARNARYAKDGAGRVRGDSLAGGLLSGAGAAGMNYAGAQAGRGDTNTYPNRVGMT